MNLTPLPVDEVLPELVARLGQHPNAVLIAPTGAGKTTRVPPALLDAGLAGEGRVVVLEPRRLAARAAARRMAREGGVELGREVGYQVRFDRRWGRDSRIVVVTEGVLVGWLQEDPFLEGVGALVFDEFHERNLEGDLALAMARRVQCEVRGDLHLVAMSATLEPGPLAHFLGDAPVVESSGRSYPVEVRYRPPRPRAPLEEEVAGAVREVLAETRGDVLVFLPGVGEIRRARERLEGLARAEGLLLFELYGDLPPERQDEVLVRANRRKVILATNVAESSVTIEGIESVVDSGLRRAMRHDPAVGLDRLELGRVSRASAEQRTGRAGRTAPGLCLRLWSELDQRALRQAEEPELLRVDLAATALQLLVWGEADPAAFGWFEGPRPEALASAKRLLERLGAIDAGGVTADGRLLARFGLHPRLGRLLLAGQRLGYPADAALAAALLAERDPFLREPGRREARGWSSSDLVDRVRALAEFERSGRTHGPLGELHRGGARLVLRAADEHERLLQRILGPAPEPELDLEEALCRAAFVAWPDRLARRRGNEDRRALMVGGRGVRLRDESAVMEPELFVCLDLDAGGAEALVRQASAVEREWLSASELRGEERLEFDPQSERVTARRLLLFEDLVLEEAPVPPADTEAVARVLLEAARSAPERALSLDDPALQNLVARVEFLRTHLPELELPQLDPLELLPQLCRSRSSFEDLRAARLQDHLRGRLDWRQLQALEREAPERLRVPSGSEVRLTWQPGRPPVLPVRIQELYGLAETPRLARGRVPVLLHLLAPNMRPQQVTDDLASFWANTYPQVRKDLRGRYPRHSWPEDPLTAEPTRSVRRH